MALHRRHLLTALGTTGVAALAGCPSLGDTGSTPETPPPLSEHTTKLVTADADKNDSFGGSVAVAADGTTALVGASGEEAPHGVEAGAAYVFKRSSGSWTQQAKLVASDGDSEDFFGRSVAVAADGTTALVGAQLDEDSNGKRAGAAYVFDAAGGSWTQQAKLAATDGDSQDLFGGSVAVTADGTTALVGAGNDEDPTGVDAGAAYVFDAAGGSWTQQAKLAASDGDAYDEFGGSVAVAADGTTALVGAYRAEDPNGEEAGAAYVFDAAGGSWPQQAKIVPADGDSGDHFGVSVAMASDGTTALVGAPQDEDPNGEEAGAVYVFDTAGRDWSQQAKLAPANGDEDDEFGGSMAVTVDGTTALVGAYQAEDPDGEGTGMAYGFEWSDGSWHQRANLAAAEGDSLDWFGSSVAMAADGTTALVGAPQDEDPNGSQVGAAYVFERAGGSWPQ